MRAGHKLDMYHTITITITITITKIQEF